MIVLENFASTLEQALASGEASRSTRRRGSMGDLLGLAMKGLMVNFVVRRVARMVPAWDSCPGHDGSTCDRRGRRASLRDT